MKRFLILCALLGVFGLAALLLQPADGQGVLILGLVDNDMQFGATTVEKTQRVIPSADTLTGINSKLSKITAPSGFTSGGTFLQLTGNAQSGDATHIQLESSTSLADDALNGYTVYILRGTGAHQAPVTITDYVGATDTATVASWPTATPDTTSLYRITGGTAVTGDDAYVTTDAYGVTSAVNTKVQHMAIYGGQTVAASDDVISTTNGVDLDTFDGMVEYCDISGFRGTGVRLTRSAGSTTSQIRYNQIGTVHTGVETTQPDTRIVGNMVVGYRDYGIKINSGDTACMTEFNHCFGGNGNGIAYYVDAGETTSTHDKMDDSFIGVWVTGNGFNSSFNNLFSQKCWNRNMLIHASKVCVNGGRISTVCDTNSHTGVVGIEIGANARGCVLANVMHDVNWVVLSGSGGFHSAADAAIRLNAGASDTRITNYTIGGHDHASAPVTGQVGIHIAGVVTNCVFDVTSECFDNSGDVFFKVDDPSYIVGCDITIREKLREQSGLGLVGSAQNLIDIASGWSATNTITLIQSDGTRVVYTGGEAL